MPSRLVSGAGSPPEPATVNRPVRVEGSRQNPDENTMVSSGPHSAPGKLLALQGSKRTLPAKRVTVRGAPPATGTLRSSVRVK